MRLLIIVFCIIQIQYVFNIEHSHTQSTVVQIGAVLKKKEGMGAGGGSGVSQPNAQFTEIKREQFLIYNDEKHPLKIEEFQKDALAQKALNLAIVKFNELNANKTTMKKYLKFDKLLNGSTVQPIEIKIYLFKIQLIETLCDNKLEFRKNLMRERQVRNAVIDKCKETNRIHQCLFDVRVSPWEKFDANKYKFNRLHCK